MICNLASHQIKDDAINGAYGTRGKEEKFKQYFGGKT
jgi:hypothetical protein